MTHEQNLLIVLEEECIETAQRVSKAIRFGFSEIQPDQPLTNAQRIIYEFNDIYACMELLQEQGIISHIIDREAIEKKKAKIKKYTEYSVSLGTVK